MIMYNDSKCVEMNQYFLIAKFMPKEKIIMILFCWCYDLSPKSSLELLLNKSIDHSL